MEHQFFTFEKSSSKIQSLGKSSKKFLSEANNLWRFCLLRGREKIDSRVRVGVYQGWGVYWGWGVDGWGMWVGGYFGYPD